MTTTSETRIESARKRPGMYVGDTTDGSGATHLVFEVLGNAFDQYLAGRCSRVEIVVDADGTVMVTDDGPGLPVDGDETRPPLEQILTTLSERPTIDGHKPHVHLWPNGVGLFVVNALSERFEMLTTRDGVEARVAYARGEPVEPLSRRPNARNGTRVRFRPDPQIFGTSRILRWALSKRLEELAFLAPKLTLTWTFVGDAEAAHGLAGRVALAVPCPVADVAKHHGTYETPNGPVDVDVALAWRGGDAAPTIDSFVNLERIPRGTHVSGLLDGVRRARGTAARRGLVAAVSVVLADVKLGEPTRERLITPEVRKCVALATVAALRRAT